ETCMSQGSATFLHLQVSDILSNTGGLVGLLVGMSFISAVEMAVIICELIITVIHSRCASIKIREQRHLTKTSIHGLHTVGRPKAKRCIRIFWLLVFMVAFSTAIAGLVNLIKLYLTYPTNVAITVHEHII